MFKHLTMPRFLSLVSLAICALANIFLNGFAAGQELIVWLITLAAMLMFATCVGQEISGRWTGIVQSVNNRVSLSKLQMLAWTVLVLSALVTAAASNLCLGDPAHALDIDINGNLLGVMGIATTTLVASPALLHIKDNNAPTTDSILARKDLPEQARLIDIFRGDLTSTEHLPDLSKIQQFLVTALVIGIYAVAIGKGFLAIHYPCVGAKSGFCLVRSFPVIGDKMVWLIGISHAGYLAYKAAPLPGDAIAAANANAAAPKPAAAADDGAVG